MGFLDKVTSFLKREAKDVGEGLGKARDKFDTELAKKEREIAATPAERMEMLQDQAAETDARFDEIAADVGADTAKVTADREVSDAVDAHGEVDAEIADAVTVSADESPSATSGDASEGETDSDANGSASGEAGGATDGQADTGTETGETRLEKARREADELLDELRAEIKEQGDGDQSP